MIRLILNLSLMAIAVACSNVLLDSNVPFNVGNLLLYIGIVAPYYLLGKLSVLNDPN